MASIKQLKSGNFNVRIRINGSSQSKTFKTETEAQAWADKVEQRLTEPTPEIPPPSALPTIFKLGLLYREQRLKGKGSYRHCLSRLNILKQHLKDPVDLITPKIINDYKNYRLKKVSPDTVRSELQLVSRIYNFGVDEFIIDCPNPVSKIKIPKAVKSRNRVVESHELQELINATSPVMGVIFELAYETAMRRSEILKLRKKDLHLPDRLLSVVDGKTGDRLVPLTVRAVSILKARANGLTPDCKLFDIQPHSVSTAFRRARQAVGLDDDVKLHQLRHTRCTIVARKGFNNAQIMAVTGHTDVRSVQRYTHLSAKDVVDLI